MQDTVRTLERRGIQRDLNRLLMLLGRHENVHLCWGEMQVERLVEWT